MPVVYVRSRERPRLIPDEAGLQVLKAWVEDAPNIGDKGARILHVNTVHTARGAGAKVLSFMWLDIPFRAAGAAVRAGLQPGRTCPMCSGYQFAGSPSVVAERTVSATTTPPTMPVPVSARGNTPPPGKAQPTRVAAQPRIWIQRRGLATGVSVVWLITLIATVCVLAGATVYTTGVVYADSGDGIPVALNCGTHLGTGWPTDNDLEAAIREALINLGRPVNTPISSNPGSIHSFSGLYALRDLSSACFDARRASGGPGAAKGFGVMVPMTIAWGLLMRRATRPKAERRSRSKVGSNPPTQIGG